MTDVANRNRVTKGVSTGGQFATEARAEPTGGVSALSATVPEAGPTNVVTTASFDDREYDIDLDDAESGHYVVYEQDDQLTDFNYAGDPEDHDSLQAAALQALEDSGDIERCSECQSSLDDGEGWNGLCGNCADQAEDDGEWDEDDEEPFTPNGARPHVVAHG